MSGPEAQDWLEHEDNVARSDRIARLDWLAANYPSSEDGFLLSGGWLSLRLLEEAKYCFAYGQFLATAVISVAFIERELAALLYGSGRSDLERAGGADLLREALGSGWLSQEEFELFDNVRRLRNPIVHFRRPVAPETLMHRAVVAGSHPEEIVESDARNVLRGVFHLLENRAF